MDSHEIIDASCIATTLEYGRDIMMVWGMFYLNALCSLIRVHQHVLRNKGKKWSNKLLTRLHNEATTRNILLSDLDRKFIIHIVKFLAKIDSILKENDNLMTDANIIN